VSWGDGLSLEPYQYAFRLTRGGSDPVTTWSWHQAHTEVELNVTDDSVCYVLELKRLVDDSVQTFEERCVEQPDDFTSGLRTTPEDDIAQVLRVCHEPPAGYEGAWCEARRETCEVSPDEVWCAAFTERCAAIGTGGTAGVGGNGGRAGGGGTTSTTTGAGGTGEAGGEGASDAGRVQTKGCGCALPGNGSREPMSLGLVALCLLALRRRRS
jgi:MYXO-CTERM domain-containing protein